MNSQNGENSPRSLCILSRDECAPVSSSGNSSAVPTLKSGQICEQTSQPWLRRLAARVLPLVHTIPP